MEQLGPPSGSRVKRLVKPPPGGGPPLHANELLDGYLAQRILVVGGSGSGKSNLVANLVLQLVGRPTDVYLFSTTARYDPVYREMARRLEQKFARKEGTDEDSPGVVEIHPDLFDGDGSFLPAGLLADREMSEPLGYRGTIVPRAIFILDDLTLQLRNDQHVDALFKTVRHLNSILIAVIHDLTDLRKGARQEVTRAYIFPGSSKERFVNFLAQWGFASPLYSHERLYEIYRELVQEHCFMRLDKASGRVALSAPDGYERALTPAPAGTPAPPHVAAQAAAPAAARPAAAADDDDDEDSGSSRDLKLVPQPAKPRGLLRRR